MRGRAAAALLAVTSLVGLGAAPATAAQGGDYAGTWTSVDTDQSNQVLRVIGSGRGAYGVRLYDDAGTVCGGSPVLFNGSGHLVEGDLVVRGSLACLPGGNVLRGAIEIWFSYDEATGTLVDGAGVVWTRG